MAGSIGFRRAGAGIAVACLAAAVIAVIAPGAPASPVPAPAPAARFQGLGDLPGGEFQSLAAGVSADGSVVVGTSRSDLGDEAFRWTRAGGLQRLGALEAGPDGLTQSSATGVSADGNVVVGYSGRGGQVSAQFRAFRWTPAGGMQSLGVLNHPDHADDTANTYSMAHDVSADGNTIVGQSGSPFGSQEAFRWTPAEGMRGLGDMSAPSRLNSIALAVSSDGSTAVGRATGGAFRWTAAGGMQDVPLPAHAIGPSIATEVNADGSVVAGRYPYQSLGEDGYYYHDFRWSAAGGSQQLPTGGIYALSADGSVVLGVIGNDAAIWTSAGGVQRLKDVLERQYGLDLAGWTLNAALDLSADGTAIVGWGHNPAGQMEGWVAVVPEPTAALPAAAFAAAAALRRGRRRARGGGGKDLCPFICLVPIVH